MRSKPTLEQIRTAIVRRQVISFSYRGNEVRAEPRIFGHAVRTHAFVLLAWQLNLNEGWQLFRFGEMRNLEVHDVPITFQRPPCGPIRKKMVDMDIWAMPIPE